MPRDAAWPIGDWRVIFIEDVRSITVIAVGNRPGERTKEGSNCSFEENRGRTQGSA